MLVYKIQRSDGLFSEGGTHGPFFSKTGKIWTSLANIKAHLRQCRHWPEYENCLVQSYELCRETHWQVKEFREEFKC